MEKNLFKLPVLKKGIMIFTLLTVIAVMLVVSFRIGRNSLSWAEDAHDFKFVLLPIIIAIPVFILLRPLYMRSRMADISGGRLRITDKSGRELYSDSLSAIHTMMVTAFRNNYLFKMWDRRGKEIMSVTCNMVTTKKQRAETQEFVAALIDRTRAGQGEAVKGNNFRGPTVYYHSTLPWSGPKENLAPEGIKKVVRGRNRRTIAIVAVALVALMAIPIWIAGMSEGNYDVSDEGIVTFKGKVVEGAVGKEFRNLTYLTGKDSSHVYFRGKVQDYLDPHTVRAINASFIIDKDGIYREPAFSAFSNRLKKVEGVDNATFRALGSSLFADKDHVFYIDPFSSDVVVAVTGDPLPDPKTTEEVGFYFFKDTTKVFFMPLGGAKPHYCPDVDAATFEKINYQVYKDNKNVYYVTVNLTQEGGNKQAGYDILRGADAPTFRMVDNDKFEDKNTTWTIEKGH